MPKTARTKAIIEMLIGFIPLSSNDPVGELQNVAGGAGLEVYGSS